jgi:hypothetical protein
MEKVTLYKVAGLVHKSAAAQDDRPLINAWIRHETGKRTAPKAREPCLAAVTSDGLRTTCIRDKGHRGGHMPYHHIGIDKCDGAYRLYCGVCGWQRRIVAWPYVRIARGGWASRVFWKIANRHWHAPWRLKPALQSFLRRRILGMDE